VGANVAQWAAHRSKRTLRLAALLAMRRPTIIELPRIYTDDDFRDRMLAYVEDPIILRFWRRKYAGSGRRPPPAIATPGGNIGRASLFAGGQGGVFGELHCKLGHAVQIKSGLRLQSSENGNISNIRRRLSAISLPETPIPEPRDR
jgi:hypothetical protein